MKLGVNIDHIAVLREARRINNPDPLQAIAICEKTNADQITIHLREDRRHIQDGDVAKILKMSKLPINLECAIDEEMIEKASQLKPDRVTLVPEKREEVTTEGGLDISGSFKRTEAAVKKLQSNGIAVSLFIDPKIELMEIAKRLNVEWIELHTGAYANIFATLFDDLGNSHHAIKALDLPKEKLELMLTQELQNITASAKEAKNLGLKVAAGHGLNLHNVGSIVKIDDIEELNIGQSIIAHSIWVGLETAIKEMQETMKR